MQSWGRMVPVKSTLASVLAGREEYEVTGGSVSLKGREPAGTFSGGPCAHGVFLAFQYPVEIPGVSNANFLKPL